jgi:hypothetical protein
MKKQADYIQRIEIRGLWGRKNISWELQPDVNILITVLTAIATTFGVSSCMGV